MSLPRFSVTRPVFASVILIVLLALGLFSLTGVQLDLLPELNLPVAVVVTSYPGAGPEEVESLVTRPLESAMATVARVDTVSSVSAEGSSLVLAEFDWGVNIDNATIEMREAIDMVKGSLPEGAGDPRVLKFDPSMMPVMTLGVSGPYDPTQIQNFVDDTVVPRLERLPGVASVAVDGARQREIQIRFDPSTLAAYGISLEQVSSLLQAHNLNLPGGNVTEGARSFTIRTMGEFDSVDMIGDVLIPTPAGAMLRLAEIAEVVDTYKDYSSLTRLNGNPSLGLSVQKESGANTVNVSRLVKNELERLEAESPPGFEFVVVIDQATFIIQSLQGMVSDTLIGGLLAVIILMVFLRDWRSTLVISIAIPFSIIATFSLIFFANITVNLLSLGGLALGVGMMVDNAIVVLENIFRFRQEGSSARQAAIDGANEVSGAITASTLTTLSVFLPVVFLKGLAAEIFRDLSLTVSFSLAASLLVALTGVPLLAARLFRGSIPTEAQLLTTDHVRTHAQLKPIAGAGNGGQRPGLAQLYERFLTWSLRRRRLVIAFLVGAIISAGLLMAVVPAEFLPAVDEGQIFVDVELPSGTSLAEADKIMSRLEALALSLPEAEQVFTRVGGGGDFGGGAAGAGSVSGGQVQVVLVPRDERQRPTSEVADHIREAAAAIAGVRISVTDTAMFGMGGGGTGSGGVPIEVQVKGDDLAMLRQLTDQVAHIAEQVEGVREVTTSFDDGLPELRAVVDRQRAATLGITPAQVAQAVRTAVTGQTVTRLRSGGSEVDVTIRLNADAVNDRSAIANIPIATANGSYVPLLEVADLIEGTGPTSITRSGQVRVASVSASLAERALGPVVTELNQRLNDLHVPSGYSVTLGGEAETMGDAFSGLALAAVMGFLLMYLIMAAQFESFVFPLSVMTTVPMSLVGVVYGLAVTGRTFNAAAFVGLITVMGVIVNNAIVLVDYTGQLRRRGLNRDAAIVQAGAVRLRPILMTALTTILATIPLALGLGEGAEIQAPLATVVAAGLLVGTGLTLIVLPVIYTLFDDWFNRKRARNER